MKENNGWVKLHRKILDWGWYSDRNVRDVFIHLILTASHEKSVFLGQEINIGERVFGIIGLSKEVGITIQQTRTALGKLKATNEITIKSTNKFSVVSINNYCQYQENNKQNNKRITNEQQTDNNIQEYKNIRNKEDIYINPEKIKEISLKYNVQENSVNSIYEDLVLYCKSNGKKYKDYEAALMNWIRRAIKDGKVKASVSVNTIPKIDEISEEQRLNNLKKLDEIRSNFGKTWIRKS